MLQIIDGPLVIFISIGFTLSAQKNTLKTNCIALHKILSYLYVPVVESSLILKKWDKSNKQL